MSTYDVELGNRVIKQITTDPESHDQKVWTEQYINDDEVCRTTRCYAGWAVALARPDAEFQFTSVQQEYDEYDEIVPGRFRREADGVVVATADGHRSTEMIHRYARDLLGLTPMEAAYLFDQDTTVGELIFAHHELSTGKHWDGWKWA